MIFLENALKWGFAVLFSAIATMFIGGFLFTLSLLFIDPLRHQSAHRSVDSSNLRQIGQASLIYALDHQERLPDALDLPDYARLLALGGGLNDASNWIGAADRAALPPDLQTVLVTAPDGTRALDPRFSRLPHLFTLVLGGLAMSDPPTTPIAWTRGLDLDTGLWRADSPYGGDGGYIAFLAGNVSFYRTLQNPSGGELVARDGRPTHRLRDALPPQARISADPGPPVPRPTLAGQLLGLLRRVPAAIRVGITLAWPLWMLALLIKLTLASVRTWGVPIAHVRIESRTRWLLLPPIALLLLSVVFRV